MTTAARVLTAHTPHEGTGPSSPWAYQPGRVLHGFQLQQQHPATQQQQPRGSTALTPQRASCVSRSLLSARLLSRRGGEAPQPMHEECSEASDDDGCFLDDHEGETESWSWMPAEEGGSVQESDRSSLATASSQPIAIPASCYFKDEMQRAALDKLNQKRQWYQQQLEAERMMARSMAKSRHAGAPVARTTRPAAGRPGAPA